MDSDKIARINSWKRFSNNKLWKYIVAEMQKKISECDIVINTIGGDSEVKFSMRDVSILKRDAYYDLIKIPDDKIADLYGTDEMPTENFDPYANRDDGVFDDE